MMGRIIRGNEDVNIVGVVGSDDGEEPTFRSRISDYQRSSE